MPSESAMSDPWYFDRRLRKFICGGGMGILDAVDRDMFEGKGKIVKMLTEKVRKMKEEKTRKIKNLICDEGS